MLLSILVAVGIWQALANGPGADSKALSGPAGSPAPNFALPSLRDSRHALSLEAFRGRPLVINFWASWCVPCRTEMPVLEASFRTEGNKVAFVGIDVNDTSSAARAFLRQVHVTYPVAFASSTSISTGYDLFGLPTTVFISPSGKILGRHLGQLDTATLHAALHEAFRA